MFYQGVLSIFDYNKIDYKEGQLDQLQNIKYRVTKNAMNNKNANKDIFKIESDKIKDNIKTRIEINILCDFCDDPVYGKPCA
jgi:hypothetical protein